MFNSPTSSFDAKKAGDNSGTIRCAASNDCTLEKSPDIGSLIFNEGIFSSSNCFSIMADFLSLSAKLNAISQEGVLGDTSCDDVDAAVVAWADSGLVAIW